MTQRQDYEQLLEILMKIFADLAELSLRVEILEEKEQGK